MFIPTTTLTTNPTQAELAYTEFTVGDAAIVVTSSATAITLVTASAVVLDGSTRIAVEFYAPLVITPGGAVSRGTLIEIFGAKDGGAAASLGVVANPFSVTSASIGETVLTCNYLTPASGSWVYSARAYVTAGTGQVLVGTGGAGAFVPGYIRVAEAPV
jgi:hypothetical protein